MQGLLYMYGTVSSCLWFHNVLSDAFMFYILYCYVKRTCVKAYFYLQFFYITYIIYVISLLEYNYRPHVAVTVKIINQYYCNHINSYCWDYRCCCCRQLLQNYYSHKLCSITQTHYSGPCIIRPPSLS